MFAFLFMVAILLMVIGIAWQVKVRWSSLWYVVPVGLAIAVLVWVIVPKVGW